MGSFIAGIFSEDIIFFTALIHPTVPVDTRLYCCLSFYSSLCQCGVHASMLLGIEGLVFLALNPNYAAALGNIHGSTRLSGVDKNILNSFPRE